MPRSRTAPLAGSAPDRSAFRSLVGVPDADERLAVRVVLRPKPLSRGDGLSAKFDRWLAGEPIRFTDGEVTRLELMTRQRLRRCPL